ncbi:MAG: PEP/pyruvate-binding domain-containing protein [Pseudonocardia sp.]
MYTVSLSDLGASDLPRAGGKGANLGELIRAGLPVPPGFVVTTAAFDAATADVPRDDPAAARAAVEKAEMPDDVRTELLSAYRRLGGGPVAVRSSATAEDLPGASFAGQQETFLDVRGEDALVDAVRRCWASLWTDRAVAYRERQEVDPSSVSLAVVVQKMADADAAGVMFTANPATGRRDETVISAAWGLGESVVGGTVGTDDLVVDRAGRVRSRTTADKAVMTVATGRGTAEAPVPLEQRCVPVLDDAQAAELARLGARVQEHFGCPEDVEWARADGEFLLVQARPITALPEPEGAPPTEWPVEDPTGMYVRASMPNPLSPLFADLVDPAVERSLRRLFAEGLGRDLLRDGDVGLPTINGYAYYHYTRRGMWRMTAATPRALPLMRGAVERWRTVARPRYASAVDRRARRDLAALPAGELLDESAALLEEGCGYYTSVQTIIPVAVTTEVGFTRFYEALVRRAGDPPAAAFLLGFDSTPIRAEKSLYDVATWTRQRPALAAAVRDGGTPDDPDFQARFRAHLQRYGHTVYNLDLAEPVPADDPAPVLDTLRFFLDGGVDPHERQRRAAVRRAEATAAVRARLDPLRRAAFDRLLAAAQAAAPVREDALADVGLAWPLIRRMLHELGGRLAAAGAILAPEDVHWLRAVEVHGLATAWDEGSRALPDHSADVAGRRALWRARRRVTPPQMLPHSTWLRVFDSMMPAPADAQEGPVLRGVAASAGSVTGAARVVTGPADFARFVPGDVLVASVTTPAWTPLFARAAAVVTDIGGPLSHGSIVAREYGIPAVLGTGVATRRIADGEQIRVDGGTGTVTLLDGGAEGTGAAAPARPRVGRPTAVAGAAALGAVAAAVGAAMWWRRR